MMTTKIVGAVLVIDILLEPVAYVAAIVERLMS